MEKIFVLYSDKHKQSAINFLSGLSLEVLYSVTISEYEKVRTTAQNSRYWSLLQIVAEHVPDEYGELHSKEWWHYKIRCDLGYVVGTCRVRVSGISEPVDAPMPKSTTKMSTVEMSDCQEQIVQLLVEHGIPLPEWV